MEPNFSDTGEDLLLKIVIYPDPILQKKSEPVDLIDDGVISLAEKMIHTLSVSSNGVGLAAPQVGKSIRMIAIDPTYDPENFIGVTPDDIFMMINPELVEADGVIEEDEGCLSLPDLYYPVERPERVKFNYTTLAGEPSTISAVDLMAKLLCHEVDHLNGILLWDHLSRFKREWLKKKFKKMSQDR